MTNQQLEKAIELRDSYKLLGDLKHIFSFPYPRFYINKRIGFTYDNCNTISFVKLDEKTREELKEAVKEVISKRQKEISQELKEI